MQLNGDASGEAGAVQAGQGPRWPSKRQRVRLLSIENIDQRTHAARNAKQIRAAVIADLGREDRMSTLQAIMADNAAVLACQLADLKVRRLRGDEIDPSGLLAFKSNKPSHLPSPGCSNRLSSAHWNKTPECLAIVGMARPRRSMPGSRVSCASDVNGRSRPWKGEGRNRLSHLAFA